MQREAHASPPGPSAPCWGPPRRPRRGPLQRLLPFAAPAQVRVQPEQGEVHADAQAGDDEHGVPKGLAVLPARALPDADARLHGHGHGGDRDHQGAEESGGLVCAGADLAAHGLAPEAILHELDKGCEAVGGGVGGAVRRIGEQQQRAGEEPQGDLQDEQRQRRPGEGRQPRKLPRPRGRRRRGRRHLGHLGVVLRARLLPDSLVDHAAHQHREQCEEEDYVCDNQLAFHALSNIPGKFGGESGT
mmetsp:Transcript_110385/g.293206  ORF Transcript_110385/g.293206 Transcript_110385/m.293206 type:complete len:245 (+) Transcript_110385:431-1165(+)